MAAKPHNRKLVRPRDCSNEPAQMSHNARQALGIDPTPQQLAGASRDAMLRAARFGPPPGKENVRLGSLSNRDLGDMMIMLSGELQRHTSRARYDTTNAQFVNDFLANFAPEVFWLCDEAARRGLHNDHLELVMRYPDRLQNKDSVTFIARELEKFGNIVKLYT